MSFTTLPRPDFLPSSNSSSRCFVGCYGTESVARDLCKWLADTGGITLLIEPGSPWKRLLRAATQSCETSSST
jgi:hypothetical protein